GRDGGGGPGAGAPDFHLAPGRAPEQPAPRLHIPGKIRDVLSRIYDEPSGVFTYTNAGHLPPLLVRDGETTHLDVNGTVVGAFPSSNYGESRVDLKSSDLLVCYTDGVTEPENEYGEMFGEDRLIDLLARNSHR